MLGLWSKITQRRIWERIFRERLSEPAHLNLLSIFVALFGSTQSKIYFDLLLRQSTAFGLLQAAEAAKREGVREVVAVEFGVAAGAGLINMCHLAERIGKATGIKFRVVGFDSGTGMPAPQDYRDHPDLYKAGDFPMGDSAALRRSLPAFADLIVGPVEETARSFLSTLSSQSRLGFVAIDVDYYSSTMAAFDVLRGGAEKYLRQVLIYLDDVQDFAHNPWMGELLAVADFNSQNEFRKIAPYTFLRERRLFKRAVWINQMYGLYVLDHEGISPRSDEPAVLLANPYLKRS